MSSMKGRRELLARLEKIQGAPRKAARDALEKGAQQIVATAKNFVPAKTGALRDSIGYTFGAYRPENPNVRGVSASSGGADPDLSVTVHAGNAKAYYASFVEFGTSPHDAGGIFKGALHPGTAAQPFFFPAYRINARSVKARVTRAMRKAIRDSI